VFSGRFISSPGGGGAERSEVGLSAKPKCPEGARLQSMSLIFDSKSLSNASTVASPPFPGCAGYNREIGFSDLPDPLRGKR
jgi:hypothetical protein